MCSTPTSLLYREVGRPADEIRRLEVLDVFQPIGDARAETKESGALTGRAPVLQRPRTDAPAFRQLMLVQVASGELPYVIRV